MKMTEIETAQASALGNAIRAGRAGRDNMRAQDLSEMMTKQGFPMNRDAVLRIETGQARLPFCHAVAMFRILKLNIAKLSKELA